MELKPSEDRALGLYLSNYPENQSFSEIIERIKKEDYEGEDEESDINIWEPFENEEGSYVAEQIESAQEGLTDLDKYEAIKSLVNGVYDNQILKSVGFLNIDPYETVKQIVGK